jgi:hypothetical protein
MKTLFTLIIALVVTTCSAQKFYQYQRFTTNLDGTLINGNTLTNVSAASPVVTASNFVSGVWYTNASGRAQAVSAPVNIILAAVIGTASIQLQVDAAGGVSGTKVGEITIGTTGLTLSGSYFYSIVGFIPTGASYVWTNLSSGAGNSAAPVSASGRLIQY